MSFLSLIVRNLVRRRVRSALTIVGIGIGITTVVALGAITSGAKAAAGQMLRIGDADFLAAQKGASDLALSAVTKREWRSIEARPDVARAVGVLYHVSRVGSNPYFITFGIRPHQLAENPPALLRGTQMPPDATTDLVLGRRAASSLGVDVGDTLEIEGTAFRVIGVFTSENRMEDVSAFAPLTTVQRIAKKLDVVTGVYVTVRPGADPAVVAQEIEDAVPAVTTIARVSEYGEVDQGIKVIDAMYLAISVLAVVIGAIGVMNTMIMSVFDRTREIGTLRAIGWSGQRILRMILGESLILCLVAAGLGIGLGVLASRAVLLIPAVSTFLTPAYTASMFLTALAVAFIVALAGAAYPAFRAVRLSPMEALRYE